jgi:outer membrane protein OmpA-like peptidoglycan-associated protein
MTSISPTAILLPALLIVVSGCATKGWVQETLDRRDAQIGQRMETVDGQVTTVGQQVTTVGQQVNTVGQRVGTVEDRVAQESQRIEGVDARVSALGPAVAEANQTARRATDASGAAMAKAEGVDQRLTRLWANRYNPKLVDTTQILFGFDRADLDDRAQTSLVNLAKELQANPSLTVELTGYTDMRGPREYNYLLSQRRVDAVRRFLVERGVQLSRIRSLGLGPVSDGAVPDAEKRRVTAKLMIEQD